MPARVEARTRIREDLDEDLRCTEQVVLHSVQNLSNLDTLAPQLPRWIYSIPQAVALILQDVHSISDQGGRPFCFVWTSGWKRRVKRGVLCENRQPRCLGRVTRASASAAPAGVRSSARLNTTSRTSRIPVHSARELTVPLVPWWRSRDVRPVPGSTPPRPPVGVRPAPVRRRRRGHARAVGPVRCHVFCIDDVQLQKCKILVGT